MVFVQEKARMTAGMERKRERVRERDVGACERERERAERQQSGWTCDFIKSSSILP
jgi:hypothetical protein